MRKDNWEWNRILRHRLLLVSIPAIDSSLFSLSGFGSLLVISTRLSENAILSDEFEVFFAHSGTNIYRKNAFWASFFILSRLLSASQFTFLMKRKSLIIHAAETKYHWGGKPMFPWTSQQSDQSFRFYWWSVEHLKFCRFSTSSTRLSSSNIAKVKLSSTICHSFIALFECFISVPSSAE